MTQPEENAELCEWLGIPAKKITDCYCEHGPTDVRCQCIGFTTHHPALDTWPGFPVLIEKLKEKEMRWDHMAIADSEQWGASVFAPESGRWYTQYGKSLPAALYAAAVALMKREKERG